MDYKNAGVDIEAGYRSVELMKEHVQATMRPEVLSGLGGFSGAFSMAGFQAGNRCFSWTISHVGKTSRRRSRRSYPVLPKAASRQALP